MTYKKIMQYSSLALVSLSVIAISTGGVMAQDDTFDEFDDEDLAAEEALGSVIDVVDRESNLSTLYQAIEASSLEDTLADPSAQYTLFAPTDQAFETLPQSVIDDFLDPSNQDSLDNLLSYHTLGNEVPSTDVPDQPTTIATLAGNGIEIALVDGNVQITDEQGNQYQVVTADLEADNGVVHTIDGVLLNNDVNEDTDASTDTDEQATTKGGETETTEESTTKGGEELEDTGMRVILPLVFGVGFIAVATKLYKTM